MSSSPPPDPNQPGIDRLRQVMARLRHPQTGCPWDLVQDFSTIAPYTIEEAYEVADAIARNDMPALKEELGDLLLQVVYHAQMASEADAFDFDAVADAIADKMISRHPHVFGDGTVATPRTSNWEQHKAAERAAKAQGKPVSVLDGVALALPALMRAEKLQKRASRVGFDWNDARLVLEKLDEEIGEVRQEIEAGGTAERLTDEIGDVLFVVTNLARHLKVDPEAALRQANAKFERRFAHVERRLAQAGRSVQGATLEEMEALWVEAKLRERTAGEPA